MENEDDKQMRVEAMIRTVAERAFELWKEAQLDEEGDIDEERSNSNSESTEFKDFQHEESSNEAAFLIALYVFAQPSQSHGQQKHKMTKVVEAEGYTVRIRAVAGIESCCYIDGLDLAFDMGFIDRTVVGKSHVFITHGHVDHINAFVTHAARRSLQRMKPAKYYVPAHLVAHMENILKSAAIMQEDECFAAHIIPVEPEQEVHISEQWMVRAVPTHHRVHSLGYILYQKKTKLKEEYSNLDRLAVRALRMEGQEVTCTKITPEIAYTGDTSVDVFNANSGDNDEGSAVNDLLRVKVLITEIVELADRFQHVRKLILVHFSARYKPSEIEEIVQRQLPPSLREKVLVGY